jgi:signal transduction histidine kinase
MLETAQLVCLSVAAVVDSAVLVALADRRNRQVARMPLVLMMLGVWLWHVGLLATQVALPVSEALAWLALLGSCTGALLMPCAMLHAVARLWRTGLARLDRANRWHVAAYLPMLALFSLIGQLQEPDTADLLTPLRGLTLPYLIATSAVNVLASIAFWRLRRRPEHLLVRSLFTCIAVLVLVGTALHWLTLVAIPHAWPEATHAGGLISALWPVLAVLVLAYFMARHDVLELVVDRSIVYAAMLLAMVLVHQIVLQEVNAVLPRAGGTALAVLEVAALAAIILACRPMRRRCAEALRYLMGPTIGRRRASLQRLAIEMSTQAGRPTTEAVTWFAGALRTALDVDFTSGWLLHADGKLMYHWGEPTALDAAGAMRLVRSMEARGLTRCTPRDTTDPATAESLQVAGAALAVTRTFRGTIGLMLLGKHRRNALLTDEEVHAVLLLVEQLAVTLDNGALQAERGAADRRAAQAEKLSALGLLASSIAHEVRNPLSAIKTIAAVLGEDLGPDSPHAEDIRLILGEIDRLTATTNELLDRARPKVATENTRSVTTALSDTWRLLSHRAREQDVQIVWRLHDELPAVRADGQALREIFFNLLANALDAAGRGGSIAVSCTGAADGVVVAISDSGPGIPNELRERLFEPFLTTKIDGTGLGLYAVGRRVRELGGEIACVSEAGRGTTFRVRLAIAPEGLATDATRILIHA